MAIKFGGFSPEQTNIILLKSGFKGPPLQEDEAKNLIASNPRYNAAYALAVKKAIALVEGRPMATGGYIFPSKNARGKINRLNSQDNPEYAENIDQQAAAVNRIQETFPLPQEENPVRFAEGGTTAPAPPIMPPGFVAPTGPATTVVTDYYNPATNQTFRAGSGGYTPGPGWVQGDPPAGSNSSAYAPPPVMPRSAQQTVSPAKTFLDAAQQSYSDALKTQQAARDALAASPSDESLKTALLAANSEAARLQEARNQATFQFKETASDTPAELIQKTTTDPMALTTTAATAPATAAQTAAGLMTSTGSAGDATVAAPTTGATATSVMAPTVTPAGLATASDANPAIAQSLATLNAAQGQVPSDAVVQGAETSAANLSQLGLNASQIAQATQVQAPPSRNLQTGELVSGSTVDMAIVKAETNFAAATGAPSTDATVQGQLTQLMADFEGGNPPAWAAGAMRAATAAMAQRGLGASSMAGQAIIQAAMESALPIAQIDAATFSRFEEQSLSNRQQTAMFAAEKRAEFLGLDFNQEFQTRVSNAAAVSDIANLNFNAGQQVALENAQLTQTVDLNNLSSANAKIMSDAAAMSQIELTNLNNRQAAQVENAKSFLQMDLSNLDNAQQTSLFKSQQLSASLLSDVAAENAASQFNASSQNQTNLFFANLSSQIAEFNNEQANAMSKFNAGEANAISEFNATQRNFRGQFNAQNSLIIEQANADWYQKIATTDNAAINQANRESAAQANNMTTLGFGAYMQEVRDLMSYAWQTANNDADRATNLAVAKVSGDAVSASAKASRSSGLWTALGTVVAASFG